MIAIEGNESCQFAVLEDPISGDWFGEDPAYPGSALIRLEPDRVIPATAAIAEVLAATATIGRTLRQQLQAEGEGRLRDLATRSAAEAASALPRPGSEDLALDLARTVEGLEPPPARWSIVRSEVQLETLRSHDDPLERSERWNSTIDMLVTDAEESRIVAERLVLDTHTARRDLQAEVDRGVREVTIAYLREHAPELEPWIAEQTR